MKIDVKQLTTCGVAAGSDIVEIAFIDAAGNPVSLRVPLVHAQSMLMTLPRLVGRALRNATGSAESRFVFPLGQWRLEAATEQSFVIATLSTEDGFEVSFGIPPEACRGLGWALKREAENSAPERDADAMGERICLN